MDAPRKKILLTEGSSLTARETLTALRPCHYEVHVLSSTRFPLCRFSRWKARIIPTVDANEQPCDYLRHLAQLAREEDYAAILPTHEQAWLIAESASLLPANLPVAVASAAAFRRVQSKIAFAELLDELGIPQPAWHRIDANLEPKLPFPLWVKAEFGTAGRTTRRVVDAVQLKAAVGELSMGGGRLMVQSEDTGTYGQVSGIFDQGRPLALHTTVQTGGGAGNSAAARLSVDFPETRQHLTAIGALLRWHGALTLDFLHLDGQPRYLECNPRMVEPGNAAAAGVNFPALLARLSQGERIEGGTIVGPVGVRTHSLQALLLGAAESRGTRRRVLRTLRCRPEGRGGIEALTPIRDDPTSLIPLAVVLARLLANPQSAATIVTKAVHAYSIRPETISRMRRYLMSHDTL